MDGDQRVSSAAAQDVPRGVPLNLPAERQQKRRKSTIQTREWGRRSGEIIRLRKGDGRLKIQPPFRAIRRLDLQLPLRRNKKKGKPDVEIKLSEDASRQQHYLPFIPSRAEETLFPSQITNLQPS